MRDGRRAWPCAHSLYQAGSCTRLFLLASNVIIKAQFLYGISMPIFYSGGIAASCQEVDVWLYHSCNLKRLSSVLLLQPGSGGGCARLPHRWRALSLQLSSPSLPEQSSS